MQLFLLRKLFINSTATTLFTISTLLFTLSYSFTALGKPRYIYRVNEPSMYPKVLTPYLGVGRGESGVGLRYSERLSDTGPITAWNNSISWEGNGFHAPGATGFSLLSVGLRWDFHLVPQWSLYVMPEVGAITNGEISSGMTLPFPLPTYGAFFHFAPDQSIRVEFSQYQMIQLGLTMAL